MSQAIGRYIAGMPRNEGNPLIDAIQPISIPARAIDDPVADLQLRIRNLRRTRNQILALEKGMRKSQTEDDHALVGTKARVLKELKECEDDLRELLK